MSENTNSSSEAQQSASGKNSRKITIIAITALIIILVCCAVSFSAPKEMILNVGSSIEFGSFEQNADKDGAESIQWLVAGEKDGKYLLVSKYCLEARAYDDSEDASQSWESSSLREYLNGQFFETAFNEKEQGMIAEAELVNSFEEVENGTEATMDKVFILSSEEISEFLGDDKEVLTAHFADDEQGLCWWWVRTPGYIDTYVSVIKTNGVFYSRGDSAINPLGGVRPAIWIESK